MNWFWPAFGLYNCLVFLLYALDKWKARRGRWRTPEATLLWLAAAGGALGATLAIFLIRHKSRKPLFAVGVPVMLAAQVALYLGVVGLP